MSLHRSFSVQSFTRSAVMLGLGALPLQAQAQDATPVETGYTVAVKPDEKHGIWEGWGCSFAWWARAVGGGKYNDLYADLFFTNKTVPFLDKQLPGLDLNILRYNVGGGGLRDERRDAAERIPDILPWHRDIPGYWINGNSSDPQSQSWDWTRDANQRAMMQAAVARGVNQVEFFSNAPMWWMMDSKSAAGGHLLADKRRDFAVYLATVVKHAQDKWGVRVNYIEPFNEPSAGWWNYPKNQEGANIPRAEHAEILRHLRYELDARGLHMVAITAADENTMKAARDTHEFYKKQGVLINNRERKVADLVEKVNVHSYNGLAPWRDNNARVALRESVGTKTLWANEFGNPDGSGMKLAQTVMEDLSFLRPTAWLYWQVLEPASAWGLVNGKFGDKENPDAGQPTWAYYNYYVMAQFTRFLRPGQQVLGNSDPNSVIAYDAKGRRLVIITVNYAHPQTITYDFSNLQSVANSGSVTTTNTNGSKLFERSPLEVANKRFTIEAEANSVYSIVIDGVVL